MLLPQLHTYPVFGFLAVAEPSNAPIKAQQCMIEADGNRSSGVLRVPSRICNFSLEVLFPCISM